MRRKWNEKTVERYYAEGRGSGHGKDYKPWLTVHDLSSLGESRRVHGLKTGREHHLLSNVEYELFLLLEWSSDITDIREQFPLDRDLTTEIAAELGIRHPCYPGTNVPTVMTVDMLVTRLHKGKKVFEAFDAKRTEAAEDRIAMEKLEIQRYYCEGMGIPHHLVFHTELPQIEVENIEMIRSAALKGGEQEPHSGYYAHHKRLMVSTLQRSKQSLWSLSEFCDFYERSHGLRPGDGLRIAKMLMFERILVVDLSNNNLLTAPISSFKHAKNQLKVIAS